MQIFHLRVLKNNSEAPFNKSSSWRQLLFRYSMSRCLFFEHWFAPWALRQNFSCFFVQLYVSPQNILQNLFTLYEFLCKIATWKSVATIVLGFQQRTIPMALRPTPCAKRHVTSHFTASLPLNKVPAQRRRWQPYNIAVYIIEINSDFLQLRLIQVIFNYSSCFGSTHQAATWKQYFQPRRCTGNHTQNRKRRYQRFVVSSTLTACHTRKKTLGRCHGAFSAAAFRHENCGNLRKSACTL